MPSYIKDGSCCCNQEYTCSCEFGPDDERSLVNTSTQPNVYVYGYDRDYPFPDDLRGCVSAQYFPTVASDMDGIGVFTPGGNPFVWSYALSGIHTLSVYVDCDSILGGNGDDWAITVYINRNPTGVCSYFTGGLSCSNTGVDFYYDFSTHGWYGGYMYVDKDTGYLKGQAAMNLFNPDVHLFLYFGL